MDIGSLFDGEFRVGRGRGRGRKDGRKTFPARKVMGHVDLSEKSE